MLQHFQKVTGRPQTVSPSCTLPDRWGVQGGSGIHLVILLYFPLTIGAEIAEVVRDGVSRTLPCSSSDGRPYRWSWCRVNRLDQCEPIPLEVGTDGQSLHRTFYTNSTTGVYSCVAKDDESTVFDTYYQLSAGEQPHGYKA